MIDIEAPSVLVNNAKSNRALTVKFIALLLGLGLIAATVWTLWYFLSPSRAVQIPVGESYSYAGYSLKVITLTNRFCPNASDIDCQHWLNEDGVQLSYTTVNKPGVTFDYLGLNSKPVLELDGLKIELLAVKFKDNTVKLRLTKQ
jgi:hypothetical protein